MKRDESLDALRGFAILAMVLSSSIAFGGILPAWMYHAQVPPPSHVFNPELAGITWVDLVFPFFLFSMGAAIPLSLKKISDSKGSLLQVFVQAIRRYLLLTFFALFSMHMRAGIISATPGWQEYMLSIVAFLLICFQFYEYKGEQHKKLFKGLKIAAFVAGFALLALLRFKGNPFKLDRVDIIILVLGNMAFFGSILWWCTRNIPWLRIGVLPFIMAVFLASKIDGSWNKMLFDFTPLPWLYKFYYLKYLFIIVPGTLAGDWLVEKIQGQKFSTASETNLGIVTALSLLMVVTNTTLLFSRNLVLNLLLSFGLGIAIYFLLRNYAPQNNLLKKFWQAGFYLLLLGLFFEAFEGGIKKDISTFSYYFVTSGLAFFMLIGFYGMQLSGWGKAIVHYFGLNGRNPMVAYVAGNLLLIPIMKLTGAMKWYEAMDSTVFTAFFKGIIFTGIVSLITIFFTKQKWFWKT